VEPLIKAKMGILMSCLFTPPKDVIEPIINENRVVIITEEEESEPVKDLRSILVKHDIPEEDIMVHVIPANCHKGRMKAHLEEMTGGEELPFVTLNGINLGAHTQIMAMADTGDLYKAMHGKDKDEPEENGNKKNVKMERRPSMMEKFFGGAPDDKTNKKKKRRNTNTNTDASLPEGEEPPAAPPAQAQS